MDAVLGGRVMKRHGIVGMIGAVGLLPAAVFDCLLAFH
jgi:hypothetical protein